VILKECIIMANGTIGTAPPNDCQASYCRNGQSELFHTYSGGVRAVDRLDGAYHHLDPCRTLARSVSSEGEAMAKTLSAWAAATPCALRQEYHDPCHALPAFVKQDSWLVGIAGAVFIGSVMATIYFAMSMPMDGIPMPGGWTLSAAWMPMCGKSWSRTAASFVLMWVVMMAAMMLPSLLPMLWRYRQATGRAGGRLGRLTVLVGVGYFIVWTVIGAALFPLGTALAAAEMQQPALALAVPMAAAVVVLIAGALQFTTWKARQLACCREMPARIRSLPADAGTALQHGLRLGFECVLCCTNWMAILLVIGVMDLRAMGLVTAAITTERLAPRADRVAQALGVAAVAAGLLSLAQAAAIG
jgi:predicted metal-binding membrane protein